MTNIDVCVIGAGVSGLIAAQILESKGYSVKIIDKAGVGGRVGADIFEGVPLDHGFQVLLTAYPLAKKYLDYKALDLQLFDPGAFVVTESKTEYFGDPLRDSSSLWSTMKASFSSLGDKLKIFKLKQWVKGKSVEEIFKCKNQSTRAFLIEKGFSNKIIESFFVPFFGGIFLEKKLDTSCRMFLFVFKMFSEGHAAIPKLGMSQIPMQLQSKLTTKEVIENTRASIQEDGKVSTDSGVFSPRLIIRAHPDHSAGEWNSSTTFYYEVDKVPTTRKAIYLWGGKSFKYINSWHYLNNVIEGVDRNIVSITVVEDDMPLHQLEVQVQKEFMEISGVKLIRKLKSYSIPHSLPQVKDPKWSPESVVEFIGDVPVISAGDALTYGSLNGAMMSGENAGNKALSLLTNQ